MVYLPLLTIKSNMNFTIKSTRVSHHVNLMVFHARAWSLKLNCDTEPSLGDGEIRQRRPATYADPMLIYIYMILMFYVFFTEMMKYDNCDCCWKKSNQLCFFRSKWLISFDMYPKSSNTRIEKILVERISKQNTDSHMKRQQTDHTLLASHTQTFCFCSRNPWLINQKKCSE